MIAYSESLTWPDVAAIGIMFGAFAFVLGFIFWMAAK